MVLDRLTAVLDRVRGSAVSPETEEGGKDESEKGDAESEPDGLADDRGVGAGADAPDAGGSRLFECSDCGTVYIARSKEGCSACDGEVERV